MQITFPSLFSACTMQHYPKNLNVVRQVVFEILGGQSETLSTIKLVAPWRVVAQKMEDKTEKLPIYNMFPVGSRLVKLGRCVGNNDSGLIPVRR
jgi:hypothetical protein